MADDKLNIEIHVNSENAARTVKGLVDKCVPSPIDVGPELGVVGDKVIELPAQCKPRSFTIKHSDMAACPFSIMSPEHYRTDGSCKCTDPSDELMVGWGYIWDSKRMRWS